MNTLALAALLAAISTTADAAVPSRFSGSAALRAPEQASVDHRFSIKADLRAGQAIQADGRYALTAALKAGADASSITTACGPIVDIMFGNGFEN